MTTHYSVHIEFDRRTVTPEETARIVDELEEWHAAAGTSPRGWLDVQLTIPAETLEGATRAALAITAHVTGARPLTVTTMTEAEFDARLGMPPAMPELVGVTDAAQLLGLSRQRILQMIDEGKLSSIRVGKALAIPLSELEERDPRPWHAVKDVGPHVASVADSIVGIEAYPGRDAASAVNGHVNDDITRDDESDH